MRPTEQAASNPSGACPGGGRGLTLGRCAGVLERGDGPARCAAPTPRRPIDPLGIGPAAAPVSRAGDAPAPILPQNLPQNSLLLADHSHRIHGERPTRRRHGSRSVLFSKGA
jgi:hypothetical protein